MGADLRDKDVSAMMLIAAQVNNFYKLRDHYANYLAELEKEMNAGTLTKQKVFGVDINKEG